MSQEVPKRIVAIGDVHIFNSKRFDEHRYVFQRLYSKLAMLKPDLILLMGDIVDSKIRLSPEQVDICRNFLISLSSYAPIIMIPGNHDVQLNNSDRMDSLTPMIQSIQKDKKNSIYYFKNSGIYNKYNINWAVWSCIDDQMNPFSIMRVANGYTIGLYHGVVKGSENTHGFEIGGGVELSEFDSCDIVIMGDIHKQQSFRNNEINYTGSLLQVTVDEDEEGSFLCYDWDGKTYRPAVIKVDNIFSTVTMDINDKVPNILPTQKIKLKFNVDTVSRTNAVEVAKTLKQQLGVKVDLSPIVNKHKSTAKLSVKTNVTSNNLIDYFKEFVEKNEAFLSVDYKSDLKALLDYDVEFSKGDIRVFESGDFDIFKVVINNFLSFSDKDNDIDLSNDGLVGIVGKNRSGKSTIIKAIQFALFGEVPNNSSAIKMVNKFNKRNPACVSVYFYKNGVPHKISRTILPDKKLNNARIDLTFEELDDNFDTVSNLTKESRPFTEKEIQKYLGLNETFEMLSIFSAQKRQAEFIDCKNAERLKLVHKFLGLQSFELKETNVKEVIKEKNAILSVVMKNFSKARGIDAINLSIQNTELFYKFARNEEKDLKTELLTLETSYKELIDFYNTNLKTAGNTFIDTVKFYKEIEELQRENEQYREQIELNKKKVENMSIQLKAQKDLFEAVNGPIEDFDKNSKAVVNLISEIGQKIAVLKHELAKDTKQLELDNCNSCGRTFTAKDKEKVQKRIDKYNHDIFSYGGQMDYQKDVLETNQKYLKDFATAEKSIRDIEKYDNIKIENTIRSNEAEINRINNTIAEYERVSESRTIVSLLKDKVNDFNTERNRLEAEIGKANKDRIKQEMDLKLFKDERAAYIACKQEVDDCEEELRLLKAYKKIVDKDGLPLFMLKSKIDEINDRVNTIIDQIFDFTVEFKVDDEKGELKIQFNYDNDPDLNDVALASGSETFMINLCIKVALSQISILPKVDTLFIDEGYDSLDKDTIERLPALFGVLTNYYKNIITISHMEEIKDMCTTQIHVKKVKQFTEIS